jgi:alkaline phosphatase
MLEESLLEVLSVVDPRETLIVVTSDHSHVLSFGGLNTPIGNPILGEHVTALYRYHNSVSYLFLYNSKLLTCTCSLSYF